MGTKTIEEKYIENPVTVLSEDDKLLVWEDALSSTGAIKLETILDAVHPIGFTYIQFPGDDNPTELGLNGTWSNVSSELPGDFIRFEGTAGNGKTAKTFGTGEQLDYMQRITGTIGRIHANAVTTSGVFSSVGESNQAGSGSNTNYTLTFDSAESTNPNVAKTDNIETSPVYVTVKKWRRTA